MRILLVFYGLHYTLYELESTARSAYHGRFLQTTPHRSYVDVRRHSFTVLIYKIRNFVFYDFLIRIIRYNTSKIRIIRTRIIRS
jgi:hypothetical protein